MQPTALLHVQLTADLPDTVFVVPQSGVVIECRTPDLSTLERALEASAGILRTGSLDPLRISVNGNVVTVSRINLPFGALSNPLLQQATYAAAFNKRLEWPRYKKLFSLVDRGAVNPETAASQYAPTFFSGNIGSLGDTLQRLERASIAAQDSPGMLRETVRYELSTP